MPSPHTHPLRPRILVRSSWQTVNIGDISHTPGLLRLLEEFVPEAEIFLWPNRLDNGVEPILRQRFPQLTIVREPHELAAAFEQCDFLLHSSGPALVAEDDIRCWRQETGKPFGIYGITLPPIRSTQITAVPEEALAATVDLLGQAAFVYLRDSKSLALAKTMGCACTVLEFAPDAAFACDLRDDERAEHFLARHDLAPGEFLCCIPRLRYTPYWTIPSKNAPFDAEKHARNEAMKEHDHAPLRQAIIDVVRQTRLKVLLCPEDQTQVQLGKDLLLDQLPEDVRTRTVWRPEYWLTGEAVSVYSRSAGLFGNEMHSPIMCIGHGVPAIVCRWAEQTTKGFMWEDIGLGEWLFDLDDEAEVSAVAPAVLGMAQQPADARRKAARARDFVQQRQLETMACLRRALQLHD